MKHRKGQMPASVRASAAALALGLTVAAGSGPALAQSVQLLGDHNAWSAYTTSQSSGKICFIMSEPTSTDPIPDGYGDAHFYITHRPDEGVRNEINLISGYVFASDSNATVTVGGQNFPLFTSGDSAWLEDPAQTNALAAAIRAGATMVIEGTSENGTAIRQTFSLSGATAASGEIDGAC